MKRKPKLVQQTALRFDSEDRELLNSLSAKLKLTKSDIVRIAIRRMAEVENLKKTA